MRRFRSADLLACAWFLIVLAGPAAVSARQTPLEVKSAGFLTPESVLHDERADVYLVSNINGAPSAKDNNGFIARVTPDGTVTALKWIAGGPSGLTLHAPKGMALHGDTLYVSDIDCVRRFNRTSGAPSGETCIAGATFLNDLSIAGDGTIYVTDTGIRIDASGTTATGTDAVYRIGSDGKHAALTKGADLKNPNGLVAMADGALLVSFGAAELWHVDLTGAKHTMGSFPAGQLDGLLRLPDGTILASSWEGRAVYRLSKGGKVGTVLDNIPSPADIGWDAKRNRLLVPVFTEDRLVIVTVP